MNWKFLALAAAMMMFEIPGLSQGQLSLGKASHNSRDGAASQASFLRGLGLLHNFEYPRAAQVFREAQAADPAFVLAYWGEAMSYNHPLWKEQDLPAARAVLIGLGATTAERLSHARNGRERAYLEAVEVS